MTTLTITTGSTLSLKPTPKPSKKGGKRSKGAHKVHRGVRPSTRAVILAKGGSPDEHVQFAREQGYASTSKQVRQGRTVVGMTQTIRDIVGELIREPGHCQHLFDMGLKPHPPTKALCGVEPDKMLDWYEEHEALRKQAAQVYKDDPVNQYLLNGKLTSRALSSQTPSVIGAVFSFKGPPDDSNSQYVEWRERTMAWVKEQYGVKNVVTIVEHTDEGEWLNTFGEDGKLASRTVRRKGHLHAIIAKPDATPIADLLTGKAAKAAARAADPQDAGNDAYKAGYNQFQNQYWEAVGKHVGQKRSSDTPFDRHDYAMAKARKLLKAEIDLIDQRAAERDAAFAVQKAEFDERMAGEWRWLETERLRFTADKAEHTAMHAAMAAALDKRDAALVKEQAKMEKEREQHQQEQAEMRAECERLQRAAEMERSLRIQASVDRQEAQKAREQAEVDALEAGEAQAQSDAQRDAAIEQARLDRAAMLAQFYAVAGWLKDASVDKHVSDEDRKAILGSVKGDLKGFMDRQAELAKAARSEI